MKKHFYFLLLALLGSAMLRAQEKLLYSTDFQNWEAATSSSEITVAKKTDFSNEDLAFKLYQVNINPTGRDETRFNYTLVSTGWAQAQKAPGAYMQLSALKSVTKVVFQHGATGGNRGYKLWKKNAADADWVLLSDAVANPAGGQEVSVNVNEENVALKFTNINDAQNAYMFSLKIYGNFTSTNTQYGLTTSQNIDVAGTITRTPNASEYDEGTAVSLLATANFGYKFVKWVDGVSGTDLSTENPYAITINSAKNIKAVYAAKNTYSLSVGIEGSKWGQVSLTPAPINGKYEEGTEVLLKVVPNQVTTFSYWEDNSTVLERTVIMNGDKSFAATFDEVPFIVGWDFRLLTPTQSRAGDYYSETTNTGLISAYAANGAPVSWLASAAGFSPSYPLLRLWTASTDFENNRRYLKAQFSTESYKNIQVRSLVSANYQTYAVQVLQYSLDDVTYTDLARVDITSVYNSAWAELNATLPAEAQGKQRVYLRWIADVTSTRMGNATDVDGTGYTNIFVFAEKEAVVDNDAPALVAHVPAANSASATINGAVVLTFNERVKAAVGNITLGGKVLNGVFGSKTATFAYEKLDYNTEYAFTVPAGALSDMYGNLFAGITFKFKTGNRSEPAKKLFDAVVAQDGTGDYLTVIDAIVAAPTARALPWLIYIKAGTYTGHHDIPSNKPFIHLIGQHVDSVIISDSRLSGGDNAYHVSQGATMVVNAKDCYFEGITFENSHGHNQQAGPQALALYTITDRFTMNKCYLRSYQDTYLTAYSALTDRHYIKDSRIQGAVDFIYGGGDVFFDKCNIICTRKDGGYIVAPSHGAGTTWGYVFQTCTISEAVASNVTTYFGRPWQNKPKTVFLNTTLKAKIYASGWHYKMGAIPAVFADYNTMDAQGNPVDISQRISEYEYDVKDANGNVTSVVKGTAKSSLTNEEAAAYTYENVILRTGDSWDPRLMTEAPGAPANVAARGPLLSWDNTAFARLFIIFRNGKVIGFSTVNSYTDATATAGQNYTYNVQAVGEFGALSEVSAPAQVLPLTGLVLKATKSGKNVQLVWTTASENNTSHFAIERNSGTHFLAIGKVVSVGNSNRLTTYAFADVNPVQDDNWYRVKAVDVDGSSSYSNVAVVSFASGNGLKVNPTMAAQNVLVQHPAATGKANLQLYNSKGQLMRTIIVGANARQTSIEVANLAPGVYILSYHANKQQLQAKFVKQ